MNKAISLTIPGKGVTLINTELITHMTIHPDNKVFLYMAGGATIQIDNGPSFITALKGIYPTLSLGDQS